MAVVQSLISVFKPIATNDRRLPIAYWVGTLQSTGDATGGNHTHTHLLPFKGNTLYSLEDLAVTESAVSNDIKVELNTNEVNANGELYTWSRAFNMLTVGNRAAILTRVIIPKIIFQPQVTDGGVEFMTSNSNLNVLRTHAWGYQWDPDALRLPGGPVRPGQVALYSTNALR